MFMTDARQGLRWINVSDDGNRADWIRMKRKNGLMNWKNGLVIIGFKGVQRMRWNDGNRIKGVRTR